MATELLGLRALVTGGTRGIGRATADALADAGASVVVSARRASDDHNFDAVEANLSDPAQVQALAEKTLELLGGIHVVVSNVGGQVRRPTALELTDGDWQQELAINLLAAVRLDRALAPVLRDHGSGVIVHVSSGAARLARPSSLAYSAAKAALNAYSKGLAAELGPYGVRVVSVSPGLIATSRVTELAAERDTEPAEVLDAIAAALDIPLARAGTPEEVAQLIRFLVSPAASYLTGTQFTVDGGLFPTVSTDLVRHYTTQR